MERLLKRCTMLFVLGAALVVAVSLAWADAPPGPYFNGFEQNTSGWLDTSSPGGGGTLTREQSGYTNGGYASGIGSATGSWQARLTGSPCLTPSRDCDGPFTRWGGYSASFPVGGFRTQVAIYLDVAWASSRPDVRFDFSSAMTNTAGAHLRDFVFNAGTDRATDPAPHGFFVNASTNAGRGSSFPENLCPDPSAPPNSCRAPVHITTSGWYTFQHTFRDSGGVLAVDMAILNSSGGTVASWTIYANPMSTVGGNRYGWFANEEIPDLPIDDSLRTGLNLSLAPATAMNVVGTSHTVMATVTSTDAGDRPAPGPGVPVEFDVVSGPNTGQTSHPVNTGTCSSSNPPSNCTTDSNGQVSWTYTSNGVSGTDTIQACFPERPVAVQRPVGDEPRTCTTATKVWGTATGKVTGGGQVSGDPTFSVDGVLLSVPALVPSLADPKAQASFGFVVQSNGTSAPSGNLEYDDKPAGVRIKATSIATLFITSGPCGLNTHARFTGMATVTSPTGTSNPSFTVDVDDCGDPGTTDTFRISAGSYTNGGTLIGGNIQIR